MRAGWVLASIGLAISLFASCKGDDSGGGPPHSGGNGGVSDAGPDEPLQPEIGTCKPMCCTDSECGTGKTCTPFESGAGTLGICSAGKDPSTATAPAAGPKTPVTCWTLNTSACNALTSEGCSSEEVCDYAPGTEGSEAVIDCFPGGNTQGDGDSCDNALGPWCQPGLHCVPTPS
jgi:hypothetical protein